MPRKTKKAVLQARQDPAAPFLFDESDLPMCPELLQAVKEARYKHTGARLLDNDQKALRMVELLMCGRGLRSIARDMHVSRHTIRAAREVLVLRGEMAPYKERVVRTYEEIIEVGSAKYLEALEDDRVPAAQIPVGVGIISDKRALTLGEPTTIAGQAANPAQADELSVEKLNAWFDGLKRAAVEDSSIALQDKPQ